MRWIDAIDLCVEGKAWTDTPLPFDRLPTRAEGLVPPNVWWLSQHPTGVTVRFETDATTLRARWTLGEAPVAMHHTPLLGQSGLDLYGRDVDGTWRWVGVAADIAGQQPESSLVNCPLDGCLREYKLYLPVYNRVERLEIGVPEGAQIRPVPARTEHPILYYGTSIAHGVGTPRPGVTHVALLGRRLDYPIWNLAFSGSALMEPELADLFAELDPAIYVLDSVPNMGSDLIDERAVAFVQRLRAARPETPIVLVEDRTYPAGWACPSYRAENASRRAAFKRAYGNLLSAGVERLHYIEGDALLGIDGDGTNDGSHSTDLGASRTADALEPVLRRLLFGR
jgi:hypothetical protein